jgi:tetratricopeptide (TPR) repeat protein
MVLYANEQYEFAEPCFERAKILSRGDFRWAYYLGRTQANLGRHDRAIDSLRDALKKDPGYLPAKEKLGECLLETGKLDESREVYQAILEKHPDDAAAHYGLGRFYVSKHEFVHAIEHLARACDLFPNFGAAHFALARAYRDSGNATKAQEQLELYQKDRLAWPITPDPLLSTVLDLKPSANSHLKRGIDLAEAGQLQAAAEEHELALAVDSSLVQAHIHLIRIYGLLGSPDKAEEHYRAAVALNPNLVDIYYNYGVLLVARQKYDEAMEAFRRALEVDPHHANTQNNLAYLLLSRGKLEEAAEHYRAAIEAKPDYRAARFNLGRILVQQGRLQDAIDQFLRTLEPDDDETPRCTYALAAAYARAGNRENALKYMREARQKASDRRQAELFGAIDRDLRSLEQVPNP